MALREQILLRLLRRQNSRRGRVSRSERPATRNGIHTLRGWGRGAVAGWRREVRRRMIGTRADCGGRAGVGRGRNSSRTAPRQAAVGRGAGVFTLHEHRGRASIAACTPLHADLGQRRWHRGVGHRHVGRWLAECDRHAGTSGILGKPGAGNVGQDPGAGPSLGPTQVGRGCQGVARDRSRHSLPIQRGEC